MIASLIVSSAAMCLQLADSNMLREIASSEATTEGAFGSMNASAPEDSGGARASITLVRNVDNAKLVVTVSRLMSSERAAEYWQDTSSALIVPVEQVAFSQFPIGDRIRKHAGGPIAMVESGDDVFQVKVEIRYRGLSLDPKQGYRAADREGDKVAVEGLVRRILARLRGLQTTSINSISVSGTSVSALSGGGRVLVKLSQYCSAKGYAVNANTRLGTIAVTANGKQIIIPLAARVIKAGSAWINLPFPVVVKDGSAYVPLAEFRQAEG